MNKVVLALGVSLVALTLTACDGLQSEPAATETEAPVSESPVEPVETAAPVVEPAPQPDTAAPAAGDGTEPVPAEDETEPTE